MAEVVSTEETCSNTGSWHGIRVRSTTLLTGAGICVGLPVGNFRSSYFQLVAQDAGVRQQPVPQDDVCLELVQQPCNACTQAGHSIFIVMLYTDYLSMPAHRQGIHLVVILYTVHHSKNEACIVYCNVEVIVAVLEAQLSCGCCGNCHHIYQQRWPGVQTAASSLHLVLLLDSDMHRILQHQDSQLLMPQQGRAGQNGVSTAHV